MRTRHALSGPCLAAAFLIAAFAAGCEKKPEPAKIDAPPKAATAPRVAPAPTPEPAGPPPIPTAPAQSVSPPPAGTRSP